MITKTQIERFRMATGLDKWVWGCTNCGIEKASPLSLGREGAKMSAEAHRESNHCDSVYVNKA